MKFSANFLQRTLFFKLMLLLTTGVCFFAPSPLLSEQPKNRDTVSSNYSQGLSFLYNTDYKKALLSFEKSIVLGENTAQSHYRLANLYKFIFEDETNFNHHINEYLRHLKENPDQTITAFNDNDSILYMESLDYFKQGLQQAGNSDFLSARKNMLKAVEIYPLDPIMFYNLANVCHSLKNIDEAIEYYKKSIALHGHNEQAYFGLGVAYQQKENTVAAIKAYRQVLKLNPKNVSALNNVAVMLEQADMIDDAIERYRQIIAIKPQYARAYNNLGTLLAKQKKYTEAEKLFHDAHTVDPGYLEPHYNLGHLHDVMGNRVKALEEYRLVFLRDSHYPGILDEIEALEQLVSLNIQDTHGNDNPSITNPKKPLEQENTTKIDDPVLSKLDSLINEKTATVEQYLEVSTYCVEKEYLDNALDYLETALKKSPDNIDVLMLTAKVYTIKKYYFKAIEQYRSVLKIDPKMKEAHHNLSLIYIDKQNPLKNHKRATFHYKQSM